MDELDNDQEFELAIALSLQDQIGELDSDDDAQSVSVETQHQHPHSSTDAEESTANPGSFLGLDRKAMERERLARKRKLSVSPPPTRKSLKISSSSSPKGSAQGKAPGKKVDERKGENMPASKQDIPHNSIPTDKAPASATTGVGLTFLKGEVRKTWAFDHDRHRDIKIEEVLQNADLKLAVLSSFQWDVAWLLSKLNKSTQMIFVMQAKEASTQRQYEQETSPMPNLKLCFPPMPGQVNCMHSKLMLLSHPTYLRVVVPTANLVPYDWGETGVMENMMFIIDLPRFVGGQDTSKEKMTSFGRELVYFLEAMGLNQHVIDSIYKFDFSETAKFAFVHTIGGAHSQEDTWRRTGYCGLGNAIGELGLGTAGPVSIDFVTSSIGSLNVEFLTTLYLAAQGDDGLTEYGWRNPQNGSTRTVKSALAATKTQTQRLVNQGFYIYFPTHNTVASSMGGTSSGGTICFQSKWYKSPNFPRGLLRDCKSRRKGLLMHNKVSDGRSLRSIVRD